MKDVERASQKLPRNELNWRNLLLVMFLKLLPSSIAWSASKLKGNSFLEGDVPIIL